MLPFRYRILPVILGALLFFSLLAKAETPRPEPIRIGMLLPLSGSYAAIGEDARRGINAALKESGGEQELSLFYADSKAEPIAGVSEFNKLVNTDDVAAVFVFRSPVGMAINQLSRRMKIPILGAVGINKFHIENEYAFQIWSRSDREGKFVADEMKRMGYRRIGLITLQDEWNSSVSEGLREALAANGGEIVLDHEVTAHEMDFRTPLLQLRTKKPDAVFVNVGLLQGGPLLRQMREGALSIPTFGNFWIAKKESLDVAKEAAEGVMFVEMTTALPTLTQGKDASPSGAVVSAYLATQLFVQAARSEPRPKNHIEMFETLRRQESINTQSGTFGMAGRCVQIPLTLKVIRNGKAETLSTSK